MKKKFLVLLLLLTIICTCIFTFTACDDDSSAIIPTEDMIKEYLDLDYEKEAVGYHYSVSGTVTNSANSPYTFLIHVEAYLYEFKNSSYEELAAKRTPGAVEIKPGQTWSWSIDLGWHYVKTDPWLICLIA